jgi:hypothetical protein
MIRSLTCVGLVAVGYVLGTLHTFAPSPIEAQQLLEMPSEPTIEKIKSANDEILTAAADLRAEGLYRPATTIPSPYAVLVGGVDAMEDLRTGRGVDPFTYAALYAGLASDEAKVDLATDEQGRVTYGGRVVTMYSIDRLKKLFEKQQRLLDTR